MSSRKISEVDLAEETPWDGNIPVQENANNVRLNLAQLRDDILANAPSGGGGDTPIASDLVSGTVKTNTPDADPIVYRRQEVDAQFAAAADLTQTNNEVAAIDTRTTALETINAGARLTTLESSIAIAPVRAYGSWDNLTCGNNVTGGLITGTGGNETATTNWTQGGASVGSNTIVTVPVPAGISYWRVSYRAQFNTSAGAGSRPTRVELIPGISSDGGSTYSNAAPSAGVWGVAESIVAYLSNIHVVVVNTGSAGNRQFRLRQTNNATGGTFTLFGVTLHVERIG